MLLWTLIYISLYSCSLEASEDICYNESRKDSTSEPFNTCPLVTVSVTDETNEDLIVSKEKSKIDQDELDNTNTLDIDPASYEGKELSLRFVNVQAFLDLRC